MLHTASMTHDQHYYMIDVGNKIPSNRKALAYGRIAVNDEIARRIRTQTIPKGCPLQLAEIAGTMASKQTATILPLCHPLALDQSLVRCHLDPHNAQVEVLCMVSTTGKTGVEMEALVGVHAALLCVYDLCKMFDHAMHIKESYLLYKLGGKSGDWQHPTLSMPDWTPDAFSMQHLDSQPSPLSKDQYIQNIAKTALSTHIARNHHTTVTTDTAPSTKHEHDDHHSRTAFHTPLKATTLTISTSRSKNTENDLSTDHLKRILPQHGFDVLWQSITSDHIPSIQKYIQEHIATHHPDIIFTSGGTGVTPDDCTPEALNAINDKTIPGLGALLRQTGAKHNKNSWLSRSSAYIVDHTLVITLPGNPKAILESIRACKKQLAHAAMLATRGINKHTKGT